jgi:hypothetical protein
LLGGEDPASKKSGGASKGSKDGNGE